MIRIITDSASDITRSEAKEIGVGLAFLDINFKNHPYDAPSDESFEVFYRLLEESKDLPVTSQPSPDSFLELYQEAMEAGDEVILITISSTLSGTAQSATIAKDLCGYDKIYIIDSRQAIIGERLLVDYALQMIKEGRPVAEIVDILNGAVSRIRLFGALDTLKYLRKGGRIPKTAELIGTMMGIKPIVELQSSTGLLAMAGKARGYAKSMTTMLSLVDANNNFDTSAPIYFGYTGNEQFCKSFRKLVVGKYHLDNHVTYPIGPVIGTHVGANAFAIAYLVKGE